jgi:hypothetical protein
MHDPDAPREPLEPWQVWFAALFLTLLVGLFAAEVIRDFQPVKLAAVLILAFWIPLLALHEAGHAVTATLLGWHVGRVVLGMGPTLGQFRLGGAAVEVRLAPVEGFVQSVPTNLRLPHLKSALIYFAGPGVELLLAAILLLLVGPERLLSRSEEIATIVWQSLAAAATAQGVLNLVPHAVYTPQGAWIVSDGLGIFLSFVRPMEDYAAMLGRRYNEREEAWELDESAERWKR